ncbi:MAG: hypothetical protein WAT70_13880 [Rhizobiaceae bacterium]
MRIWPAALPQFVLRQGYEERPRRGSRLFEPDDGAPVERPSGTVRLSAIAASLRMSGKELSLFERFVAREIGGGTLDFLMPHPRTRVQTTMRLAGDPPYQVRATGGDHWIVSVTLVEQGRPV